MSAGEGRQPSGDGGVYARRLSRLGDLLSWVPGTPMCARPLSSGGDHQIIIRARRGRAAIVGLCD